MQNDASCLIKLAFFFAESGEMGGLHWAFDNEIGSEIKSQSAKWNDNKKRIPYLLIFRINTFQRSEVLCRRLARNKEIKFHFDS